VTKVKKSPDKNSPERIVEKIKGNRYIAPVIASAIIALALLTYIVSVTDAWDKLITRFGNKEHEQQTRKDHELASFYLGQAVADREIYIDNKYLEDESKSNQNIAEIGAQLKALSIDVDHKSLDYRPRYMSNMGLIGSNGGILVKNGVVGLHDQQLLDYYTIGRQTEILRRFEDSNTEYQQSTAIGALRLLGEVMTREQLNNEHLEHALESYDEKPVWSKYLAHEIQEYAVSLNVSIVDDLGGSIGFKIKTNFPEQREQNSTPKSLTSD